MRQPRITSSGPVNDICGRHYRTMDRPTTRLAVPRAVVAVACVFLVIVILALFAIIFKVTPQSKQNVNETAEYKAGFVQVFASKVKDAPSFDVHSFPEYQKSKKSQNSPTICEIQPHSDYTYKDEDKIYFEYYIRKDPKKYSIHYMKNDSEIMQRLLYQMSYQKPKRIDVNQIPKKKILTLSAIDNNNKDSRRCDLENNQVSKYCDFITDAKQIDSADAVIFREHDLVELPGRNNPRQVWIYNTPSPNHQNIINVQEIKFNLTGTYDFKSHIPMLPMYWDENHPPQQRRVFAQKDFTDNTVRLAVYNKNCHEEQEFYEKFKEVIKSLEDDDFRVEWYNSQICNENVFTISRQERDCLNLSSAECFEEIGPKKKFALAFEVSNTDYISERFFHPLNNSVVPIVIGSSKTKYMAVAPRNSFIYFCDYEVEELRNMLKDLNRNKRKLDEYFSWWMNKEGIFLPLTRWYCQVCFILHRSNNLTNVIDDINPWRGFI